MSLPPKRGIKRKRGPEDSKPGSQFSRKRPTAPPEVKFQTKLHHAVRETKKVVKVSRVRELQRLVKKLKDIRDKEGDKDLIKDLEDQMKQLKELDLDDIALRIFYNKLRKDKYLMRYVESPVLNNVTSQQLKERPFTSSEHRISSSKIVAAEVAKVLASLRALFLSNDLPPPKDLNLNSGEELTIREVVDDGWESGSIDEEGETSHHSKARSPQRSLRQHSVESHSDIDSSGARKAKRISDIREHADSISNSSDVSSDSDQLGSDSESMSDEIGQALELDGPESSFLPSLAMGYLPGNGDGSDWSGNEDAADIDPAPRKNRRGQRARKAIWEKKYGKNANHLKKAREDGTLKANWKYGRPERGGKTYSKFGNQQGVPKGDPLREQTARHRKSTSQLNLPQTAQSKQQKKVDGPLHPSWDAARRKKAQPMVVPSTGKKIVF
ncbi:Bud-site selection protein [Serendipita vermifera]|nr:Bud-site selection protein [Serendipita vermifera]